MTGVGVGPLGVNRADAVTSRCTTTDRRHAEELTPLIHEVLGERDLTVRDLDILVVDVGPGRFTGLRVGLATVRALAFATGLPVVGLTSLEILAGAHSETDNVTAVVDARRGEVFQQVFTSAETGTGPTVGSAEDLAPNAAGLIVGDGVDLYNEVYAGRTELTIQAGCNPDPRVMLAMAADREPSTGDTVAPLYLRDPDVNPNVKTRPVADRHSETNTAGRT